MTPWLAGLQLIPFWRNSQGQLTVATKIEFTSFPVGELPEPTEEASITLNEVGAQALIDSLWDAGIRPTKGSGSAGSFEAQGKHLEDMRALVFHKEVKVQATTPTGGA
jgi:hypothetical protein